jgi:hypothetical protein
MTGFGPSSTSHGLTPALARLALFGTELSGRPESSNDGPMYAGATVRSAVSLAHKSSSWPGTTNLPVRVGRRPKYDALSKPRTCFGLRVTSFPLPEGTPATMSWPLGLFLLHHNTHARAISTAKMRGITPMPTLAPVERPELMVTAFGRGLDEMVAVALRYADVVDMMKYWRVFGLIQRLYNSVLSIQSRAGGILALSRHTRYGCALPVGHESVHTCHSKTSGPSSVSLSRAAPPYR